MAFYSHLDEATGLWVLLQSHNNQPDYLLPAARLRSGKTVALQSVIPQLPDDASAYGLSPRAHGHTLPFPAFPKAAPVCACDASVGLKWWWGAVIAASAIRAYIFVGEMRRDDVRAAERRLGLRK